MPFFEKKKFARFAPLLAPQKKIRRLRRQNLPFTIRGAKIVISSSRTAQSPPTHPTPPRPHQNKPVTIISIPDCPPKNRNVSIVMIQDTKTKIVCFMLTVHVGFTALPLQHIPPPHHQHPFRLHSEGNCCISTAPARAHRIAWHCTRPTKGWVFVVGLGQWMPPASTLPANIQRVQGTQHINCPAATSTTCGWLTPRAEQQSHTHMVAKLQ